jgi:hypothetical protein
MSLNTGVNKIPEETGEEVGIYLTQINSRLLNKSGDFRTPYKRGIENSVDLENLDEMLAERFDVRLQNIEAIFQGIDDLDNKKARERLSYINGLCNGVENLIKKSKASKELKTNYLDIISEWRKHFYEKRIFLLQEYSRFLHSQMEVVKNDTLLRVSHNEECELGIATIRGILKKNSNMSQLENDKLTTLKEDFKTAKV